ncbi:MAG: hypothetical protein ACTS2F_07425 [Thainema sp.]
MDEEEQMRQRLNQEIDVIGINKLTELGNRAIELGLIAGHGYHKGQYELIREGKIVLMSPQEATTYLSQLIEETEG